MSSFIRALGVTAKDTKDRVTSSKTICGGDHNGEKLNDEKDKESRRYCNIKTGEHHFL